MLGTNAPANDGIPGFKVPRPKAFDGLNASITSVNEWVHSIDEDVDLSGIPPEHQTRVASFFLAGDAKTWYLNPYSRPYPPFEEFIKAFKEQFLAAVTGPHHDETPNHNATPSHGSPPMGPSATHDIFSLAPFS